MAYYVFLEPVKQYSDYLQTFNQAIHGSDFENIKYHPYYWYSIMKVK